MGTRKLLEEGFSNYNHFRDATKMISIGNGVARTVKDYVLTRYACYLIVPNGDSRKHEIAFAQSYLN